MDTIYWVLLIELILLGVSIALMFYVRLSRYLEEKSQDERRRKIAKIFSEALQKKQVIDISMLPHEVRRFKDVLPVVENFNRTYLDTVWQDSKKNLYEGYLLPLAIKHLHSHIWQRRQLSLRVLALNPTELVEEKSVLHLLEDSKYLVRIYAAACLVKSKRQELLLPVLERMSKESPMARYPYRDLLVHGDDATFKGLEEIAKVSENPDIVRICLDILSTKSSRNLLPIAEKHIDSPDLECRLAALKLWGAIGQKEQREHLEHCLSDKSWQIRAEAARLLGRQHVEESLSKLKELLDDEVWFVRLQAALALKALGNRGLSVLYQQNKERDLKAYEIAQYVMGLP